MLLGNFNPIRHHSIIILKNRDKLGSIDKKRLSRLADFRF